MTGADSPSISLIPYPGLRSFLRSEFDIFFGRDDQVSDMIEKLAKNRFLCITGPSGCGKSSLARTGLFNALDAGFLPDRGSDWIFCDLHPGTDPLTRLGISLAKAIVTGESGRGEAEPTGDHVASVAELRDWFIKNIEIHSSDLNRAVQRVPAVDGRPIVILVDQFEEVFRYAQDPAAVSRFVDVLLKTAAARSGIYVVITIRTDELENCARFPGLTSAINQSQFLTPTLDRFQLKEAIEGPIALFGGKIDPELTIWMLNGLEEQLDKLPLMQHALRLLYEDARRRIPDGEITITADDFFRVFEIERAPGQSRSDSHDALRTSLSHRLDTLYRRLDGRDQRIARHLFCALTTLESHGRDIRRAIRLREACGTIGCELDDLLRVIDVFQEGADTYLRIVGNQSGSDQQDSFVDVTHECILRLWEPLQATWLPDEHRAAETIRLLARMAWLRAGTPRGGWVDRFLGRGLLSGSAQSRYTRWWTARRPNAVWAARYLTDIEWVEGNEKVPPSRIFERIETFLRLSERHASRIKVGIGATVAVLLGLGAAFGWSQFNLATVKADNLERQIRTEKRNAASLAIVTVSPTRFDERPTEVVESAVDALETAIEVKLATGDLRAGYQKLLDAMSHVREFRRLDHKKRQAASGAAADLLPGGKAAVFAAEFGPGPNDVITLTLGLQIVVWDATKIGDPTGVISLSPHTTYKGSSQGRSLARSVDGTLAVGTNRGAVLLVHGIGAPDHKNTVTEISPGDGKSVYDLDFSSDGRMLVASSLSGYVQLWRQSAEGEWSGSESFSSAQILERGNARIPKGAGVVSAKPGNARVWSVALSPDQTLAAVGLDDGKVCVFSLDGENATCRDDGHASEPVKAVQFSPDGRQLVSAGNDDRVRIWELVFGDMELRTHGLVLELYLSPLALWHEDDIWDVDYSPDGRYLAVATWGRIVNVFQTDGWKPMYTLRGHGQALRTVRFSPDGNRILSASLDATARLWTPFASRATESGLTDRLPPDGSSQSVRSVALGPNGSWVALTDPDGLWIKEPDKPFRRLLPVSDAEYGTRPVSMVASPASADLFVAALAEPAVIVARHGGDGNWNLRKLPLEGAAATENLPRRQIAISADGKMFAVSVRGPEGDGILVCATDVNRCADAMGPRIALVAFAPRLADDRPADGDICYDLSGVPTALALSSDGDQLAVGGSDCDLRLYPLDQLNISDPTETMSKHVGVIRTVAFSPDDRSLVTASVDWQARVWRIGSNDAPYLRGHNSHVNGASFLLSGKRVATVSADERIIIWDAETTDALLEIPGLSSTITAIDVSGADGTAKIAVATSRGDLVVIPYFDEASDYMEFAIERLRTVRIPESDQVKNDGRRDSR